MRSSPGLPERDNDAVAVKIKVRSGREVLALVARLHIDLARSGGWSNYPAKIQPDNPILPARDSST